MKRGEILLYKQAIRGRWPIPEELRVRVMLELANLATASPDPRIRLGACKALVEADKVNMFHERCLHERGAERRLEVLEGILDEAAGGADQEAGRAGAGPAEPARSGPLPE